MQITFLKTGLFTFLLILAFQITTVPRAFASAEGISVKLDNSDGDHLRDNPLFEFDNIYPGWSSSKTIYVKNNNKEFAASLYFTVKFDKANGNDEFAKELKLFVTRLGSNQSVRIGGSNDRFTLDSANGENLFLDNLSIGKGKQYRIKIEFDKEAGNALQGTSTKFDLKFAIEADINHAQTKKSILLAENRQIPLENLTNEQVEAEVLGENTPTISEEGIEDEEIENEGIVGGAAIICRNTSNWPWTMALIFLTGILSANIWKKHKENNYNWIFDTIAVATLIIAWYFLENCHLLRWVPISALTIGIVMHFALLFLLEISEKPIER